MLVSATEMLKKAKAGHYAVGQFNIKIWSGQSPSCSPLRNFVPLLSWVYPKAPANIWAVMM